MPPVPATVGAALDLLGVPRGVLADVMPRVRPDRVDLRVAPRWFAALWARGIAAVTTPWGVYVHPTTVPRFASADSSLGMLMVHELMHVEQLRRHGVPAHTLRYAADYVRGRRRGLRHWDAYRAVRFEREARAATSLVRDRVSQGVPR
jgi:hypothetical protein